MRDRHNKAGGKSLRRERQLHLASQDPDDRCAGALEGDVRDVDARHGLEQLGRQVRGRGAAAGTASCWFNTSAFVTPAVYTFGDAGRNILRGARFQNVDMSLFRSFPFAERRRLEFRAEAFNMLNHVNLGQPDATVGDAGFGKVTSTRGTERQLQLALKLFF